MRENLRFSLGNVANYIGNYTTTHLTHIESLTTLFDDDQDATQTSTNPYDSSITFLNDQNKITSRTVLIDTNANYGAALSTFSSADGEGNIDVNEKINQMTLQAATATAKSSSASSSVVGGLDGSWGGSNFPIGDHRPLLLFPSLQLSEPQQQHDCQFQQRPLSASSNSTRSKRKRASPIFRQRSHNRLGCLHGR